MKQLSEFLIQKQPASKIAQNAPIFVIESSSATFSSSIDKELNIKMIDFPQLQILVFRPQSFIFPYFSQNKVTSVAIYCGNSYLTIAGNQNSIITLYQKLSRQFSHKGFNQFYRPIKRLGRGRFATVYLVEHKYTGKKMAAKVFSKQGQQIKYKGKQAFQNQIKMLKQVDHPNLIKFDGLYETQSLVYLVTQYLSGGTLEDKFRNKPILAGQLIQQVIRDILLGLAYLDSQQIMHRDIKPQNIILRQEDNRWVISDFGLAARSNQQYFYDRCGTIGYTAPEVMQLSQNEKYKQSCDTYSLGILAYQLILGELPFKVQSINMFDKKLNWVMFGRQQCKQINSSILDFLKRLLDHNPKTRITPKQALQSAFFTDQKVAGQLNAYHQKRRQAWYERILKMVNRTE